MEDFIREILKKLDAIQESLQVLEINTAKMETRFEARLQSGNDRFIAIEKQIEMLSASHNNCEMKTNYAYRQSLKFMERHLGDLESIVAHWIDRKELLTAGKKSIVSEIVKIIFAILGSVITAAVVWFIARRGL